MTIEQINLVLSIPFASSQALLDFYRKELPGRVGNYRLDEVGPIMSVGSDEEVEGYLNKRFFFNGKGVVMEGAIDWYAAPEGDLEWNGGFVRQGYFMYLADRYESTGDERYAAAVVEQMLDYIHNVPPYDPEGKPYLEYKKSTWRPFEVAGRAAENWPVALAKIITSNSMTADAFAEIYYSIYQHARFLRQHHWKTGNHACLEVAGLGVISIFYREMKDAEEWRTYAVNLLMSKWTEQFHPDGYTQEMSGAYHWVALRNFFAFYQVAQHNGMEQIFPSVYTEWLRKTAMAEFYQQKPDFSLPITNDSNVTTRHQIQLSALMAAGLLPAEDALFRLSNGREGKKPSYTSHFFPQARLAIMRSGWDSEALYASLDMGPWGCNHMNDDQLNLEVSAYGRNLLVNSGRWRYTTSPGIDWLDKAEYFKSTAAYNSVLCDGMNQVHWDADGEMRIAADSDYACGTFCAGYGYNGGAQVSREVGSTTQTACVVPDARHKREVFYAKEAGFLIVRDTLTAEQAHRYTQIWHTAGGQVEREGNVCFSCFEDANFVMVQCGDPEIEIFCGSEEPFKGWNCPAYDHLVPAPQIEASLTGQTVVFETLILPTRGPVDRSMLPVFEKEEKDGKTIYQVTVGGKTTSVEAGCMWRLVK